MNENIKVEYIGKLTPTSLGCLVHFFFLSLFETNMVCFSTHEYRFAWKDRAAWVERLIFFYGSQFSIKEVSLPTVSKPNTSKDVKMSELLSVLAKTYQQAGDEKTSSSAAGPEVVVHLGRRWIGSAQAAVIPSIPLSFINDQVANLAVENRLTSDKDFSKEAEETLGTLQSILGCYENGYEMYISHLFTKPIDLATMHALFRVLLKRQNFEKAFFDKTTNTYYILIHGRIVELSLSGLKMGDDIDFDLDDGFIKFKAWNATHFKSWTSHGSRPESVLPWMLPN